MRRKIKGFTLIELLAVIVILGLLMAIAIPSVTKYITESRKKAVASTINNYIAALANEVNDLNYTFTKKNTIYAVPIDCIALERGGNDPFGEWHQANKDYFAYVLAQYIDESSSYIYGYTFKDSAGYGMYPTSQKQLDEKGRQIKTDLNLKKPTTGYAIDLTEIRNWNGFQIDANTSFVVLDAETEGIVGDGRITCTLAQKGTNYEAVEAEKEKRIINTVRNANTLITAKPTLNKSSNNTSDAVGLYISYETNTGEATYYFRGSVANNNVKFAGLDWKIVRINEDGTIRMVLSERIGGQPYAFSSSNTTIDKMYYSDSLVKPIVDAWYQTNIIDKGYDKYVVEGIFCEEAKVKFASTYTGGSANMVVYSSYTPTFKCKTDGNGKGIITDKVGLMSYDETIYAGGYFNKTNANVYFANTGYSVWTTTPGGSYQSTNATVWGVNSNGTVSLGSVSASASLKPVINIIPGLQVTGSGTKTDPYVVQTN